ncbi:MAG TPA: DUF4873 domain-containing protein [Mycobacterium sp.]|jgi:hypothetical protein
MIDVAVICDERALDARLIAESVPELHTRHVCGIPVFDDATDTWLLDDGHRARIVIDTRAREDIGDAYFGVARHGAPNYFTVGDDTARRDEQLRLIAECLKLMRRKGATRIEVRRSAQRQFVERSRVVRPRRAFEFTTRDVRSDVYDGPATLRVGGNDHAVRVRLTGHLDPIDGKYHWQGTVFGATAELPSRPVTLAVDAASAEARITEQTPWGYAIAGVGTPPFSYPK